LSSRYVSSAIPNSSICARAAELFASPTWLNTIGATSPARIAITVITTSSSMRVKPRLLIRDTQHLLDRRDPRLHLAPPIPSQRHPPLRHRKLTERRGIRRLQELLLHLFRDSEQLEDPRPAAVAGVPAPRAPPSPLERELPDRLLRQQRRRPGIGGVPLAAFGARLPDEALREDALERGGDQVGLDLEIDEPRERGRRVVGVQCREDEMTGERRLHGDGRRLPIPHL